MARTKQTARASTGGAARRILLERQHAVPPANPPRQDAKQPEPSPDIQYCFMCQDGGQIWECDNEGCRRGVCSSCIEVPPRQLSRLNRPDVRFSCISCEWKKSRDSKNGVAYIGFTINGEPVLDSFLKVKGTFEISTSATVSSPSTTLIHFRLSDIEHNAHFAIVQQLIAEYFHKDQSGLQVIDAPFNVTSERDVDIWNSDAAKHVRRISHHASDRTIVFVTTHSDPDRGDLWSGKDEKNIPCALKVSNWFNIMIRPYKAILGGSMFFLLACGSLVNNQSSFVELQEGLIDLGVANSLAFDAKRLSTVNTVDVLTKVIRHVIIHSYSFRDALEHALNQGTSLGRHTNVIHIAPHAVTKYLWAHKEYQPWGTEAPAQCPQCGILKPWVSVQATTSEGNNYKFTCKNTNCGTVRGKKKSDPYSFKVKQPLGSKLLRTTKDSEGVSCGWLRLQSVDTLQ